LINLKIVTRVRVRKLKKEKL